MPGVNAAKFGASREVTGQRLHLDGGAYTVIGVLPADFRYAGEPLKGSATEIAVDLPAFAAAAATLAAFGAAACYVPARRATQVDPAIALRQE